MLAFHSDWVSSHPANSDNSPPPSVAFHGDSLLREIELQVSFDLHFSAG